ncbi:MAG: bifunctional diguanylate cyclase/phosphodiesterase [Clostridia bacterium]|nr:bifunctional diguanylate cyclase/phosphodiesterase [Clostridia bacterium]
MQNHLINSSKGSTFVKNDKSEFVSVTDGFLAMFKIDSRDDIIGKKTEDVFNESVIEASADSDMRCLDSGISHYVIPAYKISDTERVMDLHVSKTTFCQDDKKYIIGTCVSTSSSQDEINRFNSRLKYFSELNDDVIAFSLIDLTTRELVVLRIRSREKKGKPTNILTHRPYDEFNDFMIKMIPDEKSRELYRENFSYDKLVEYSGSGIPAKKIIIPLDITNEGVITICQEFFFTINPYTRHLCVFLFGTDVTKDIEEKALLAQKIELDSMTGIYNHSASFQHITDYLASEEAAKDKQHALCIIDVNKFKHINDYFGHKTGDDVIIKIAEELKTLPTAITIYGRLGGDEFIVFVKNIGDIERLKKAIDGLLKRAQYTLIENKRELTVSISMGLYIFSDITENMDDIYIKADRALYEAKKIGGPAYFFYNDSLTSNSGKEPIGNPILNKRYNDLNAIYEEDINDDNVSYYLNLTQNKVVKHNIGVNAFSRKEDFDSVDDLFRFIVSSSKESPDFRKELSETVDRKYLILAAQRGDFVYEDAFRMIMHNLGNRRSKLASEKSIVLTSEFHKLYINTVINPMTRDVEAVLKLINVNIDHHLAIISDKTMNKNIDSIALIGVENRTIRLIKTYNANEDINVAHSYEAGVRYYAEQHLMDEDRHNLINAMSIETITKELEHSPFYSIPVDIFSTDVESQHKLIQFSYLDDGHAVIYGIMSNYSSQVDLEINSITGLYNRRGFYSRTRNLLNSNPDKDFVIIRWDIDGFKLFNDIFGMSAGDEILASIGNAMKVYTTDTSVVGNIGGDVFVICMEESKFNPDEMLEYITNLLDSLTEDYYFIFHMAAYKIKNKEDDITIMCDRAQLASTYIKRTQNEHFIWYKESMYESYYREQTILLRLRKALAETPDDFTMLIQPQYSLVNKRTCGGECLVRWTDSELGYVSPGEFVPILEKTNLITKLDMLIWEKACIFLNERIKSGKPVVPLSINISRCDFTEINVVKHLNELTDRYEIPHKYFFLEITESAYTTNADYITNIIRELRKNGYIVEMDDFGSGYSSFNNLKTAPIDTIKIDMRFFEFDDDNSSEYIKRGNIIVSSIIRLARELKLTVIAEGIETREQADLLHKMNCHIIQGYLFAKPITPEEFNVFLDDKKSLPPKSKK